MAGDEWKWETVPVRRSRVLLPYTLVMLLLGVLGALRLASGTTAPSGEVAVAMKLSPYHRARGSAPHPN